jgi:IstB-like ATP binding protein
VIGGFFQLASRRYENGSIIITSNQSLGWWGEVFGDAVIASTILPPAPPFDHDQYQGRKLQTQMEAQGRTAQIRTRGTAGDIKNAVSRRTGEGGDPSRSPVRHKPERGISSANGGDFRVLMTGASDCVRRDVDQDSQSPTSRYVVGLLMT